MLFLSLLFPFVAVVATVAVPELSPAVGGASSHRDRFTLG